MSLVIFENMPLYLDMETVCLDCVCVVGGCQSSQPCTEWPCLIQQCTQTVALSHVHSHTEPEARKHTHSCTHMLAVKHAADTQHGRANTLKREHPEAEDIFCHWCLSTDIKNHRRGKCLCALLMLYTGYLFCSRIMSLCCTYITTAYITPQACALHLI